MNNPFSKFDQTIIRFTQQTYLLCFDYTGIYAGTIEATCAIVVLASKILSTKGADAGVYVGVVITLLLSMFDYYLQDKRQYDHLNHMAMDFIESPVRKFFMIYLALSMIFFDPMNLFFGTMSLKDLICELVYDFAVLMYFYINTVLFRDREPKEWFPKRKFAFSGA